MKILIAVLALAVPAFALAHECNQHYDRVHLSASAQTRVENNTVIASLYAQEEGSDAVQLAELVNQRVGDAIEFVKQHDAIKLQTSSYSTSPVYHKSKITGWRARQTIRLESQDMPLMSRVLGHLQQTLALQDLSFAISPALKNRTDDQLIAEALTIFEQRATNITRQLKRKNYRIVEVKVNTSNQHHARRQYEVAAMASKVAAPAIESGEQTVVVTVTGQIELE